MIDLKTQDEIMSSWKGDIREPLVTVRCMTYNHEPYIEDAIKGFLIQETNFPFQVLIHDDASTDNTAAIVKKYEKEYPLIIKGWYQSCNTKSMQRSERSVMRKPFFDLLTAKYQAICEGDDYWTDPNKLQMQIDFLENNPDYGMCYTKVHKYDQDKQKIIGGCSGRRINSYKLLFKRTVNIPTLTVCYRQEYFDKYLYEIKPTEKKWLMGDLPLWLYFLENTKIHFIDSVTGVYRILPESASHSLDDKRRIAFDQSIFDIWFFFSNMYGLKVDLYYWKSNREAIKNYDNDNIPLRFKIVRFFAKNAFSFFIVSIVIRLSHKITRIMGKGNIK